MSIGKYIVAVAASIALVGCGSSSPSIAGRWTGTLKSHPIALVAKDDSSFTTEGLGDFSGRWEVSGDQVSLFRDIKNGGDVSFGPDSDGSFHLKLAADHKTMDGRISDGSAITLTKQ